MGLGTGLESGLQVARILLNNGAHRHSLGKQDYLIPYSTPAPSLVPSQTLILGELSVQPTSAAEEAVLFNLGGCNHFFSSRAYGIDASEISSQLTKEPAVLCTASASAQPPLEFDNWAIISHTSVQ